MRVLSNPHAVLGRRRLRYDIAETLVGFETAEEIRHRTKVLARALGDSSAVTARELGERIARCGRVVRGQCQCCESAACPGCQSSMRRLVTNDFISMAELSRFVGKPYGVIVTVIPNRLTAPMGFLRGVHLQMIHRRFRRAMALLGLAGYEVVGGIDISFNEISGSKEPGYYQVHIAYAVLGYPNTKADLQELNERVTEAFRLEPSAYKPVVVKPLQDPTRQLSYLVKSVFSRRVSYIDSRGRRNTYDHPLRRSQRVEIARWLDRFEFTDRLLLHGVRWTRGRLRVTPEIG